MTSRTNPYINGSVIKKYQQFFNRKVLIENILNGIFAEVALSQAVVGQKKIGKSSFLEHITDQVTLTEFDYNGSMHLFLSMNCANQKDHLKSVETFYDFLLHRRLMHRQETLLDLVGISTAHGLWQDTWENVLQELEDRHMYLIVLFDEFDHAILHTGSLKNGIFDTLRYYNGFYSHFALITCTLQSLKGLFDQAYQKFGISNEERKSFSHFYSAISSEHTIELFQQEEINTLITASAGKEPLNFTVEDLKVIREFGGHFPYFIQCACYHFFEAHRKGLSDIDTEGIRKKCLKEASALWTDYWTDLTLNQQTTLFSIASGHPVDLRSYAVQSLKEAALIYGEKGTWYPFSYEFGKFILSQEHMRTGFPVQPETLLWKRYEVKEIVGRTLHSQVVKAWSPQLQQYRAIKLLCINTDKTDEEIEQLQNELLREARIVVGLKHKNIGEVYEVMMEPLGVIMQWVEGESLHHILENGHRLSYEEIINIGLQLAEALHHVHTKDIIHRDIKPLNIILTVEGHPILIDFDAARSKSHHTISQRSDGSIRQIGTHSHRAPEQFETPEATEPATDIFALGVVLYQLLTSEHPYPYGNDPQKYHPNPFPLPEQYDIPQSLYLILCNLLCREPTQRLNAQALYKALQYCLKEPAMLDNGYI